MMGTEYGDKDHLNDSFDAWKKRRAEKDQAAGEEKTEEQQRADELKAIKEDQLRRKYLKH